MNAEKNGERRATAAENSASSAIWQTTMLPTLGHFCREQAQLVWCKQNKSSMIKMHTCFLDTTQHNPLDDEAQEQNVAENSHQTVGDNNNYCNDNKAGQVAG